MTTKEKILKSALKLFAKQGIDKTSTAQITKDVGIASGTLFVHFKTKQELVDTLYIQIKHNAFSDLDKLVSTNVSVEKNMKATAKNLIEYFLKHYSEFTFIELVETDPQISPKAIKEGKEAYTKFSKIIIDWKNQGRLKDVDLELLGSALWNTMMVIIKYYKKNKITKVKDAHLNILWDIVKK